MQYYCWPFKNTSKFFVLLILFSQLVSCAALKTNGSAVDTLPTEEVREEIPNPDAYYHAVVGLQLENEGEVQAALRSYLTALRHDPKSAFLLTRVAALLSQFGNQKEAITYAERASQLHPDDARVLSLLGNIYVAAGQAEKGLVAFQRLVLLDPKRVDAYYSLASIYAARGDLGLAEEMIRKGIEADPASGLGYYYLGKISFEKKAFADALQHYQKALSLHPYFEQAHLEVARVHELQEKPEEAKKVYRTILEEINPRSREATVRLVQLLIQGKELDEALRFLNEMAQSDPSNLDIPLQEALIWVEKKEFAKAIEKVEAVMKGRPDDLRLTIYLASLYEESKEYEKAISIYQEILNRDGKLYDVRIRLGALYFYKLKKIDQALEQGELARQIDNQRPEAYLFNGLVLYEEDRFEEAAQIFVAGIEKNPKTPDLHFHLGATYDKLNRFDDLVKQMEKTIALDSNHANALNYLGYTYAEKGIHLNEAIDLINRALAIRPDDGYFVDSLGWAYYKKGKIQEALEALNRAVSLVPEDPVIHEHLGELYLKQNRLDLAKEAWARSLELDPKNDKLISRFREAGFGEPLLEDHSQKKTDGLEALPTESSNQKEVLKGTIH
jgi:tetratricopeptide (TPR) repeat protein